MPNTLDFDLGGTVPPWGRNATEYEAFFALSDVAISGRGMVLGIIERDDRERVTSAEGRRPAL